MSLRSRLCFSEFFYPIAQTHDLEAWAVLLSLHFTTISEPAKMKLLQSWKKIWSPMHRPRFVFSMRSCCCYCYCRANFVSIAPCSGRGDNRFRSVCGWIHGQHRLQQVSTGTVYGLKVILQPARSIFNEHNKNGIIPILAIRNSFWVLAVCFRLHEVLRMCFGSVKFASGG